ncbi:MAG: hypothetical protein QXX03_05730 [Nitrososphaerota archaeon]
MLNTRLTKLFGVLRKISGILREIKRGYYGIMYIREKYRANEYDVLSSIVDEFEKEGELIYRLSTQEIIPKLDKTYDIYTTGRYDSQRIIAFRIRYLVFCLSFVILFTLVFIREVVVNTSPDFSFEVVKKLKEVLSYIHSQLETDVGKYDYLEMRKMGKI